MAKKAKSNEAAKKDSKLARLVRFNVREHYEKKIRPNLTKRNIAIGVIVLILVIQFFQMQSMLGTFSFLQGRDSSLVTEIGQIKEAYTGFGQDLNEVRDFLRLPTKSYGVLGEVLDGVEEDTNESRLQLAMFQYVDYLAAKQGLEDKVAAYRGYLDELIKEGFLGFASNYGLSVTGVFEDTGGYSVGINDLNGANLIYFYLSKEDGTLFLKTVKSKESLNAENAVEFLDKVRDFVRDNIESVKEAVFTVREKKAEIEAAINSEVVIAELSRLGASLSSVGVDQNLQITYSVYNKKSEIIGEVVLDTVEGKVMLIDMKDSSVMVEATDISSALVPFLSKLDTKTLVEKKAESARVELDATLADKGFKLLLSEAGLSLAEAREDDVRVYYDISNEDGVRLGSIVLEKMTGVVNIVDENGANSENILFFDPDYKKKTLAIPENIPIYGSENLSDDNSFNVLIAGKHGSLLDTMIFAHINEVDRTVSMVSIPRDLIYGGRKINFYAYNYGMPELKRALSDMTGYELDKYILIDMYAFIDVVDLVGGIDIHLDSAVIDPYYRTVDNGVEGTLHYEPGDYHLGGKEALRLARSRKTSSDFARAERQQMILEALQAKARNLGFGDADTIFEIASTVLDKTETDIGINEAIAYYFRYQNYEIVDMAVMSSGNVLYVPPYITTENCNAMIEEAAVTGAEKPGCEDENHAYTLLPRNNNWNLVKWFFREHFEG